MYCNQCAFTSSDYSEWKAHLISPLHQVQTHDKVQNWPEIRNQRSIVVKILPDKDDHSMPFSHDKVFNYFAGFSGIFDFYMHPDSSYFVIELESSDRVQNVLSRSHQLGTRSLQVTPKVRSSSYDLIKPADINESASEYDSQNTSAPSATTSTQPVLLPLSEYLEPAPSESTSPNNNFNLELRELSSALASSKFSNFDQQLSYLMSKIGTSDGEIEKQQAWFSQLENKMKSRAPDCLMFIVKGGYNYLGWSGNELKILVHVFTEDTTKSAIDRAIDHNICHCLQILKEGHGYSDIRMRVHDTKAGNLAVISLKDHSLNMNCKFVFSPENVNKMAQVYTVSRLVSFMISFDLRARMLMDFVMFWRKCHVPFISELQMQMLVIFYLIREKLSPTVARLQNLSHNEYIIDGWNFSFSTDFKDISRWFDFSSVKNDIFAASKDFLSIARDFFLKFSIPRSFEVNVVGVPTGKYMEKDRCSNAEQFGHILRKMYDHFPLPNDNLSFTPEDLRKPMVIQHPFLLTQNMCPSLTQKDFNIFISRCTESAKLLNKCAPSYPKPSLHTFFEEVARKTAIAGKSISNTQIRDIKESLKVVNTRVVSLRMDPEFHRACSVIMDMVRMPEPNVKIASLWRHFICEFFDSVWSQTIFGISTVIECLNWKGETKTFDAGNSAGSSYQFVEEEYEEIPSASKSNKLFSRSPNLHLPMSHPLYPLIASSKRSYHHEWNEFWNWTDINEVRNSLGRVDLNSLAAMLDRIPTDTLETMDKMCLYLVEWLPYFWFSRNKVNQTVEDTGKKFSNPMEKQLYITEQAMSKGNATSHAPKGYGAMFCEVSMADVVVMINGINVGTPVVTFSFSPDQQSSSEWPAQIYTTSIPCLAKVFKELIPKYVKWRFRELIVSKVL